jgi:hypothetical protein
MPTTPEPFAALEQLWTLGGGDDGALEGVRLTGR